MSDDETAPEMLTRLGTDAMLWAQEFNKTAVRLGYSEMDEGWLVGWFANAIENCDVIRCNPLRAENEKLREERQELKNELAKWANYWRDKDVKALSADIHGLREALKPFAHLSDRIPSDYEDDRPDVTITLEKVPVKVIRAAAAALGKSNNED